MVEQPRNWKWSSYRATAGKEKPHCCLTTDWLLGQFSGKRIKAEKEYRQFVRWGIGKESIWTDVKGQTLLGEDEFVDSLLDHLKKHKDVSEIPKSQRYVNRPALAKIFTNGIHNERRKRDKAIAEAVEKHGYRQKEVADHLGLHYSTVSNILRQRS